MSEVKSWYEDAASKLRASAELAEKIGVERDQIKAELDMIRRYYQEAIDVVDEVFQSTCETEPILPDFLLPGDSKFHGVKKLAIAYRETKAELSRLQAEREPRDNCDGTVTAWLPVTYLKGLPVECVRSRREGDRYVQCDGDVFECPNSDDETSPWQVWLILRPAPHPPEPVTWVAPLADGEWSAGVAWLERGGNSFRWDGSLLLFPGITKPAKLGRYRFENGVGTLIEAAQ